MDVKWGIAVGVIIAIYMGTSYWVFTDVLRLPRMLQLHSSEVHRDLAGMGALGWLVGCLLLWLVAFPSYLVYRGILIHSHQLRYYAFHKAVTEAGLSTYLRRQALINGLYLVAVAFIPQILWSHAQQTSVAFLYETGAWAGWALFACGLLVLAILAAERSVSGLVRKRMAIALMPGLPLLVFSILVAIFAIAHLEHILIVAEGLIAPSGGSPGMWASFVTYGWILLFWMFPAVAVVNMATEAFAPGLTAVFSAIRSIWRDDTSQSNAS